MHTEGDLQRRVRNTAGNKWPSPVTCDHGDSTVTEAETGEASVSHPSKIPVLVFMVQSKRGLLTAIFKSSGGSGSPLFIRMSLQGFNDPLTVPWVEGGLDELSHQCV